LLRLTLHLIYHVTFSVSMCYSSLEVIELYIKIILNDLLDEKGISHRELSRMTGIRHPSISEMCNNQTKRLPLDNLAKICEVLDCEITDVLKLVKEPK